jgi:hypothetical protein
METLSQAKTPDALMIASDVLAALVNLVLRPLLAISFLVLYYDAKARAGTLGGSSAPPLDAK